MLLYALVEIEFESIEKIENIVKVIVLEWGTEMRAAVGTWAWLLPVEDEVHLLVIVDDL